MTIRSGPAAAAWALAAVLALPAIVARPVPAAAHAIVLESSPVHDATLARSPERVLLRFNSKIEKRLTRVTLAAGQSVPVPAPIATAGADAEASDRLVIPLGPLPPGVYVLRYKVLAVDGHITEGALRFRVSPDQ